MKPFLILSLFWLGSVMMAFAQEALPVVEAQPDPAASKPAEAPVVFIPSPAAAVAVSNDAAPDVIPQAYPQERYQETWAKNPFLLKVTATAQPIVSFANDWALAGMFNNQGKIRVTIQNKQTGETQRITNEDGKEGEFRLIKANFHRDRTKASVEVGRGSETAELKYDDTMLSKPLTMAQGGAGRPPGQGGPPQVAGMPGQPSMPPGQNNAAQLMQNRMRQGVGMPGQKPMPGNAQNTFNGGVASNVPGGAGVPQTNVPPMNGGVVDGVNTNPGVPQPQGTVPPTVIRRRLLIPPSAPSAQ